MVNNYDKNDIIKREAVVIAGAMKVASYRVKDIETGEFGNLQFHLTLDNHVMAVLSESSARLLFNHIKLSHPEVLE